MDTTVKTHDMTNSDTGAGPAVEGLQPFLHDACVTLYAPSFAISHADGQIDGAADGFYHGDSRALARLTVAADGVAIAPVRGAFEGADRATFRSVLRGLGEETPDPAVTLHRRRHVTPGHLEETLEVANAGRQHVHVRLIVTAGTDLAPIERVKSGHAASPVIANVTEGGLGWSRDTFAVRLTGYPRPAAVDPAAGTLAYDVELAPGSAWTAELHCDAAHEGRRPVPRAPRPTAALADTGPAPAPTGASTTG
ncbi:glycogen debranching N-terminal domain-containing protein [Streptomyces yanii]|uniref:glycogen debranching N-terminal domain-containing protein n=1 Tax=Streptomyces yanii TaxID=78510 RepID=UPI0031EBC7BF